MSKHLATVTQKNSPFQGRNLRQNRALGGRPSALTGWGCGNRGRERENGMEETESAGANDINWTLLRLIGLMRLKCCIEESEDWMMIGAKQHQEIT